MLGGAMAAGRPKLYVIPGSFPCAAVEVALGMKSIGYDRVELVATSQLMLGPLLYGGNTVPGMRLDGERLVGSIPIMRRLDALEPEPPLLPAIGSDSYAEVLEAERWGEQVLQSLCRRMLNVAFLRRPKSMESYLADATLKLPPALVRPALPFTARILAFRNKARDEPARAAAGGDERVHAHRLRLLGFLRELRDDDREDHA
jgi:glutathione S-transferase